MSGGSFEHKYLVLRDFYQGFMEDKEMDELILDLTGILKSLEWWQSCDNSEETYRKNVSEFKEKWFNQSREVRLKGYVDEGLNRVKNELYEMIGEKK